MATQQEELIHKIVDEISFGLISPKDLRKQSVVEIQTPDTYPLPRALWTHRTCCSHSTHRIYKNHFRPPQINMPKLRTHPII